MSATANYSASQPIFSAYRESSISRISNKDLKEDGSSTYQSQSSTGITRSRDKTSKTSRASFYSVSNTNSSPEAVPRGRSLPYISLKPSSYDRKNHLTREAILKRADNSLMHFRTNGENISPLMAMLRKDLAAKFQAALDRKSNHENLAQKENRTENNDFDEQDSKQSSFDTIRKKSSLESSFNEDKAENSLKLGFEENTLTPQSNSEKISNNKIEDYKENQLTTKHPHKTFSVKKETSSEKLPQINYKLANLSIKNQPEGKITSTKIHNDLSNPAKITDGENKISKSHQTDEKRKTPTGIMRSKTEVDGSFFVKRSVSFSSDLERIRVMTPIVKYNYSKHERCSRVRKPRNSRTSQSSSSKPI